MDFCSLLWAIPFLGIIFSMSLLPLVVPRFWHKYSSYVPFFWLIVYLSAIIWIFGIQNLFFAIFQPLAGHYISFIVLIAALYITSGGIFVDFPHRHGPIFNTLFLFLGSILAGWIGTTGASTLLIRPLLRANSERSYKTHIVVFFIFLISNIGGAATPLGDPPLFIGFLEGIDFFWFLKNLYLYIFFSTIALCLMFFIIDVFLFKKEKYKQNRIEDIDFVFEGYTNLFLILCILLSVIFCNFDGEFILYGEKYSYASMLRSVLIGMIALISWKITPTAIRKKNYFSFAPICEVAELFIGIFITVTPIIYILHKGSAGEMGFIFNWIAPTGEFVADRCFWVSGFLSSILDNAPTFLIFFHMISGNALEMMTVKANLLIAISIATVFMGALTYIGNAPNLMVKSISEDYGVSAPSFIGYIIWSMIILFPLFFVITRFL